MQSACTLLLQQSKTNCTSGQTYGCTVDGSVWISGGCRGWFVCAQGSEVQCGRAGKSQNLTCQCSGEPAISSLKHIRAACDQGLVRYFHIPKTATSFISTLWAYGCPQTPMAVRQSLTASTEGNLNIGKMVYQQTLGHCRCMHGDIGLTFHHQPLRADEVNLAVGLFRTPLDRLVSAYHYDLHVHGLAEAAHRELLSLVRKELNGSHRESEAKGRLMALHRFASWPGVAHVQSKMLLQYQPASRIHLSPVMAAQACDHVWKMQFVGLTECFAESVLLFQRRFPARYIQNGTHTHFRKSASADELVNSDRELLRTSGYHDAPDEAVYRQAARRFFGELRQFGADIPISSRCMEQRIAGREQS